MIATVPSFSSAQSSACGSGLILIVSFVPPSSPRVICVSLLGTFTYATVSALRVSKSTRMMGVESGWLCGLKPRPPGPPNG